MYLFITGAQTENGSVLKAGAALVGACCFSDWREDEIQSRKASLSNTSLGLAYLMKKTLHTAAHFFLYCYRSLQVFMAAFI